MNSFTPGNISRNRKCGPKSSFSRDASDVEDWIGFYPNPKPRTRTRNRFQHLTNVFRLEASKLDATIKTRDKSKVYTALTKRNEALREIKYGVEKFKTHITDVAFGLGRVPRVAGPDSDTECDDDHEGGVCANHCGEEHLPNPQPDMDPTRPHVYGKSRACVRLTPGGLFLYTHYRRSRRDCSNLATIGFECCKCRKDTYYCDDCFDCTLQPENQRSKDLGLAKVVVVGKRTTGFSYTQQVPEETFRQSQLAQFIGKTPSKTPCSQAYMFMEHRTFEGAPSERRATWEVRLHSGKPWHRIRRDLYCTLCYQDVSQEERGEEDDDPNDDLDGIQDEPLTQPTQVQHM